MRLWREFHGCSSPVVALHTAQNKYICSPVAKQSFGMVNIRTHHIVFLDVLDEKEERRCTNLTCLVFSSLRKVSGNVGVDLVLE